MQPISLHHRLHAEHITHLPVFPCITVSTVANLSLHHRLPASLPTRRTQNPSEPISLHHHYAHITPIILHGPISIASHQRSAATPRNPSPCITVCMQNASCTDPSPSPPISAQQQPLGSPSTTHQVRSFPPLPLLPLHPHPPAHLLLPSPSVLLRLHTHVHMQRHPPFHSFSSSSSPVPLLFYCKMLQRRLFCFV
ncbi:hypothetical protein AAC387_Pa11g1214 [Persea americana]